LAASLGYEEVLFWILSTFPRCIQSSNINGDNILLAALRGGQFQLAKSLLARDKALASDTNIYGETPLHFLWLYKNRDTVHALVDLLIEAGTNLFATALPPDALVTETPASRAIRYNNEVAFEVLIDRSLSSSLKPPLILFRQELALASALRRYRMLSLFFSKLQPDQVNINDQRTW
jgi:ankyrin repeat protein